MQGMVSPINRIGFTDSRKAVAEHAGGIAQGTRILGAPADYVSVTEMKAALAAFDPFTYNPTTLNIMSINDAAYALRHISTNCKSIADYIAVQTARTS
jgi:hypothetical protein